MLSDEDAVVDHADVAERKLDRVTRDAAPVTLLVAVNGLLADTQDATRQIEQDLRDAPTLGTLVVVVGDNLGRVLDQGHDKLDIADGIHNIQGDPIIERIVPSRGGNNDTRQNDPCDTAGGYPKDESAGSIPGAWGKVPQRGEQILGDGDDGQDQSVESKRDVVELDGGLEAAVTGSILGTDLRGVVESQVGDKVREEACDRIIVVSKLEATSEGLQS